MRTLPYLEFRLAQDRHQQALLTLTSAQRAAIRAEAERQWLLEARILDSAEGRSSRIDDSEIAAALATIRSRYDDGASYRADLAANGLDEGLLREALARELRVEATFASITAEVPKVSLQDAEIFYWQHHERFAMPEARRASHILVTVNDALSAKSVTAVREEMDMLAGKLHAAPDSFAALALRYSECPTALQEGNLGWVPRGHLYPELEAELFDMQADEFRIVASPLGWHLLRCEAIRPAALQPFESVATKLVSTLQARRDKKVVTDWLKALPEREKRLAS